MKRSHELGSGTGGYAERMPKDIGFFEGIRLGSIKRREESLRNGRFVGNALTNGLDPLDGNAIHVKVGRGGSGTHITTEEHLTDGSGEPDVAVNANITITYLDGMTEFTPLVRATRTTVRSVEGSDPEILEALEYSGSSDPSKNTLSLRQVSSMVKEVVQMQDANTTFHPLQ
jgi:hypothetical protein